MPLQARGQLQSPQDQTHGGCLHASPEGGRLCCSLPCRGLLPKPRSSWREKDSSGAPGTLVEPQNQAASLVPSPEG